MEYWDLYDKDRKKLSKIVERGNKLQDDEYHLVINAWIKNEKNEYLISQRAATKSHPLMWECTGGSVLQGESPIDAAIREIKEELGIDVDKSKGVLIGSTLRYYWGCPDILDVYVFESNVKMEDIVYQKEEVCKVMWASVDQIKELFDAGKFEANAFFERIVGVPEKIYYIGFNANNAICNESFFAGSISLYPNREKGNIYYSKKVLKDTKSDSFMKQYQQFIEKTCKSIQMKEKNVRFICFNEKIRCLCSQIKGVQFVEGNKKEILDILNDKFKTRNLVKSKVPILDYIFEEGVSLNYNNIKSAIHTSKFVIQGEIGAGGDSTYLIESEQDIKKVKDKELKYCISEYKRHLPLNATLIIGDYDILYLPMSVQLIALTDKKYKYVGGDFLHFQKLSKEIKKQLHEYNKKIAVIVKEMGYRGILGIDYILTEDKKIYFMEINPRFQASSFLISRYLEKYCDTNIAELHYLAITHRKIGTIHLEGIDKSFLNCNSQQEFNDFEKYEVVQNGYFEQNKSSYYRKVYGDSVLDNEIFENLR